MEKHTKSYNYLSYYYGEILKGNYADALFDYVMMLNSIVSTYRDVKRLILDKSELSAVNKWNTQIVANAEISQKFINRFSGIFNEFKCMVETVKKSKTTNAGI